MASRKTLKFLPTIFQTDTNSKFLSATLDQLISEPELKTIHGYIGRKFAPTYKNKDSYLIENSVDRQNYQLEPSIVARDDQQNITFFASYIDLLNKIEYYGGLTNDHSRLFSSEYYSFNPQISYDAFINFTQYFWLPNGPDSVNVYTNSTSLTNNIVVHRDSATNKYRFNSANSNNSTLILARGGVYTFEVNQPGHPFWIQTEPGVDGVVNATPGISSREVMGVTNNGIDVGTITFLVPQSTAQDNFTSMDMIANVDFAFPLAYSDMQHQLLSNFIQAFPQYAPMASNLVGKTLVFVDQDQLTNYGESAWLSQGLFDSGGMAIDEFDISYTVPEEQRYGVWQILLIENGGDIVITLTPVLPIPLNKKVYIKSGIDYVNREYFKDYDGFLHQTPVISSVQNTIYYQDGNATNLYGQFSIVDLSGWIIDVDTEIIGMSEYTSPNGIVFTSGLKVKFGTDVTAPYQNNSYYVEGVGTAIRLVDVTTLVTPELFNDELAINYPGQLFPDYITINRASIDLNAWSRSNRWFHRNVIEQTAVYNATVPAYDQLQRAQRPIIQFNADYQLFNNGRIGKKAIDILDTLTLDAFSEVEGTYQTVFRGTPVVNGTRVIFTNDKDPMVRNNIYELNLVYLVVDEFQRPVGDPQIALTLASDGITNQSDSIVVSMGSYKGTSWWFNGATWVEGQQKTSNQQDPLFDMFDQTDASLSTYASSNFAGTKIFGYKRNTIGRIDPILQFPLSYRNFGTQGDIEFTNYYNTDTFDYAENLAAQISTGILHKIIDRDNSLPATIWSTVAEESKQYQLISYIYAGPATLFVIDVTPADEATIPYLKVFRNNTTLTSTQWTFNAVSKTITLLSTPAINDKIDILVYSREVSKLGQYQVPLNLDLNAQNININSLTLGQLRNHVVALSQNSKEIVGDILGPNNLRDIDLPIQGGNILQHSAPVSHSALFLLNEDINFVNAVRYAQQEYARFKNKFLEYSMTLNGIQPTDPSASVDLILTTINAIKSQLFPWYYSDMVPYGTLKNIVNDPGYTVFDPLVNTYEITSVFNSNRLSNQAILVYLNGTQLILGRDYSFNTDRPAVTFTNTISLNVDDLITIVEYHNTDGNYIPETPTKLGLYPKFVPEIFLDDTYRTAINVIRGHDGSITPAFGDYRDDFLLELETRIYNNIKLLDTGSSQDIYAIVPGKFRNNEYTLNEANQLLSGSFLNWVGDNKLDYSTNDTFNSNDPFTWNYSRFIDRIDGEPLAGSWKACYQYFYDTTRPHLTPWEMLGFTAIPDWWEAEYGTAPYTGGNTILWNDLEGGIIKGGVRLGVDTNFARPGLSAIIPVDENGILKSPAAIMTANFDSKYAATSWSSGHRGPVESAWRDSSEFPFAAQLALSLGKPGKYFGVFIDVNSYLYNYNIGQYLTLTNDHITQTSTSFNGDTTSGTIFRSAGYLNWVADYLINRGIDPSTKITPLLQNYKVNLAYKMAGFSDQKYLQILAEQNSPSSTNDSIIIPNENYEVYLYKSTPVDKLTYSATIIEKTSNGFSVRGYDLSNPYFTIIPSVVNSNASKITVLAQSATVFNDYQPVKLTVPYGYDFSSMQQVVDFLISYERYLQAQGFTFNDTDSQLNEVRNWKLSSKEFLFWAQQGWPNGSILVLSPVANLITSLSSGAITDGISDSQYGTKILDQNFNLIKNNNYNVLRTPTSLKVELTNGQVIGLMTLDLVQYEHVLVFNNTTVFNDIIYKPELGNRQFRLKLIGQKTDNWDGSLSAPGFIYNSDSVDQWAQGKDYLKGVLVQYKNQYFVALQNIIASELFDFSVWKTIDYSQIKKGLLPNFASNSVKAQSYYDAYGYFNDAADIKSSHGLIGFKPRQFLDDMGLDETTQVEFYKGYITQKGTANAIDALTTAQFNNLNSSINYYEEWAVRVGEYGAILTNPFIELTLDEKSFGVNPALAEFVAPADAGRANGVTIFANSDLYKSSNQFDGTIASIRNDQSDYTNDVPTAGYVNIDDIDATIFDLANYTDLNSLTYTMGSGYTIWTAKDFKSDWNVFRISETDTTIVEVENALDGYVTFRTDVYHGLAVDNVVMIRNFDAAFDGFYEVYRIVDLSSFMVRYTGDTTTLTNFTGDGILFTLDSLRFDYMETAREYFPPHGWKVGEKIWIDTDAATTVAQGQPYDTGDNLWKVYEKTHPWEMGQRLVKNSGEYSANIGYGQALKMIDNAEQTIFVGTTLYATTGAVNIFDKNVSNVYVETTSIIPDGANTYSFGSHIDTAVDSFIDDGVDTRETLAVGAPTSSGLAGAANVGLLYIYKETAGTENWVRGQVITGDPTATGGKFGTGFAFDELGHWLYVSAPYEATPKVYVYGLQRFVTIATGNVTTSGSVSTITVPFTRDTTVGSTDANSILVTSATRTYIPRIDYTLSGQTITFISGNVNDTFTISQGPYYALVETIDGPAGSEFGFCIDSSLNGAQLGIGAPGDTVNVAVFSDGITTIDYSIPTGVDTPTIKYDGSILTRVSYHEHADAGSVYVYDRVIESHNSTDTTVYTTEEIIATVIKVTVDDVELDSSKYVAVVGSNTVTLNVPLGVGKIVKIETNKFTLLERLIGIDSLDGSLTAIQEHARFGTALTICSNNCAFYIGAPNYDNDTIYNTGAVWKFHNRGTLYGTNTGYTKDPTFTPGDTIRLDNFEITVTGTSLDSLVQDINDANLLGITAVNEAGYLRLDSDKTVAKNRLRILSGSGTVYADAGLAIFAFMQIIVNPYKNANEYFGTKVILARNAYMLVIASERGTTRKYTTFDNDTTILDSETTGIYDSIKASGSVYTYELYDDPRNAVENPGRYAFCQQIDPTDLNQGDGFGAAIDVIGGHIVVSAPSDDATITDGGSIYLFSNLTGKRGWSLLRYEQPTVDVDSVNRLYLYSKRTNTILANLEFIDPAAGKILGQAEQELAYKTSYDPANYNQGTAITSDTYWGNNQVGQVWWNLDQVRYIDYEQGSLAYRSINWGRLFPGSVIEVLEWVESDVLPSQYVSAGNDGVPKHADNSAYVELIFVNPLTNVIGTKYYYWVKDKTSLDTTDSTRTLPIKVIQDLIENPKNNGTAYSAIVSPNALIVYNISEYLSGSDTVLHLDYELLRNSNIIHSEYELLQRGNTAETLPTRIIDKLIDSLVGADLAGSAVPDMALSIADRYGISIRPRQSMFVNRLAAVTVLLDYVNNILVTNRISEFDTTNLMAEEPQPSAKLNEYDRSVLTEEELSYIDTTELAAGYLVLVTTSTVNKNRWVLYNLTNTKTWEIIRSQSYKTSLYWDYIDWFAIGYESTTKPTFSVTTLLDALKLPYAVGNTIKITNTGAGQWELVNVNAALEFVVVGKQNGTIKLNASKLTDITLTQYIELRNIIVGLRDDIFVGNLAGEFNNVFFELMNYLFTEQSYVDWIFKTSFISVIHKLRGLTQPANYIKDNQTYYQDYINEVKPYSTKIREYLLNYNSTDEFAGNVTDFDLPAYYDHDMKIFRSPSGEQVAKDEAMWQTAPYDQWYANRTYEIMSITIGNKGTGYVTAPIVEIFGNGTGATAHSLINFDTGEVTDIIVDTPGTGYTQQVVVLLNGNGSGATAYATLHNHKVRTFNTKMKFDRISYTSVVKEWTANTVFLAGDIVSYDAVGYIVNANVTTSSNFVASDYTVHPSADFTNANDRIMANYVPGDNLPAKNLAQLIYGIDYPGVQVTGLPFSQSPGFSGTSTANITLSGDHGLHSDWVGNVVVQSEADILLNFNYPISAIPGQFITQVGTGANATVYGSDIRTGTSTNITNSRTGYFVTNNGINFSNVGNISINGITQIDSTSGQAILPVAANLASKGGWITTYPIEDASITVTKVWSNVKVSGILTSSADFVTGNTSITSGRIKIDGILTSIHPILVENISSSNKSTIFDFSIFDQVQYDADGLPMVSDSAVDSLIQSNYTDLALGTRTEDIDVVGGAYVDTYSSHAPEEMVPGIVFDTLNLQVYTKILGNTVVLGYRILHDMMHNTTYLRIAEHYSTVLASPLNISDSLIYVIDASVFTMPNPAAGIPGVIFIQSERITYYTIDLINNTLGQLRRGTAGTAPRQTYQSGITVSDAGTDQIMPDVISNNVNFAEVQVNGTITANIGDYITQPTSGANLRIIADVSTSANVIVSYVGQWALYNGSANVISLNDTVTSLYPVAANSNIPVSLTVTTTPPYELTFTDAIIPKFGDFITQASTGANVTVTAISTLTAETIQVSAILTSIQVGDVVTQSLSGTVATVSVTDTTSNYITLVYSAGQFTIGSGNISINSVDANVYPTAASIRAVTVATVIKNNNTPFDFATANIGLNSNITVTSGDYITQASTGANATVQQSVTDSMYVSLVYADTTVFELGAGNIAINGGTVTSIHPVTSAYIANVTNQISINGTVSSDIEPVAINLLAASDSIDDRYITGPVDANGNITVNAKDTNGANITLKTDNAWYNPIPGVAPSDGLGFQYTGTSQVLFLKDWPSGYPSSFAIGTEELVNIVTESEIDIMGEFGDIDHN